MSGSGTPRQVSSLRSQLSGAWAGAAGTAARSAALDPFLRAALAHPFQQQGPAAPIPFAARAALDPDNPQASLDMFRRLSSSRHERTGDGGKPPRPHSRPTDSARHTETDPSSPGSQSSLLDLLDEGWSGPQTAGGSKGSTQLSTKQQGSTPHIAMAPAAARQPSGLARLDAAAASPRPGSALPTPPSPALLSPPWGSSPDHPPATSVVSVATSAATSADTAFFSTAGRSLRQSSALEEDGGLLGGCDTPRSAVSWTSAISSALTLPQTEAELQALDLQEVERLAADAADLQARAATALKLARQRMGLAGGAGVAGAFQSYTTAAAGPSGGASKDASPGPQAGYASSVGSRGRAQQQGTAEGMVRLYLLLLAVVEVALLAGAALMQRASGGLLRLPRSLVVAPVAALRGGVCLVVLLLDLLLACIAGQPGKSFV